MAEEVADRAVGGEDAWHVWRWSWSYCRVLSENPAQTSPAEPAPRYAQGLQRLVLDEPLGIARRQKRAHNPRVADSRLAAEVEVEPPNNELTLAGRDVRIPLQHGETRMSELIHAQAVWHAGLPEERRARVA